MHCPHRARSSTVPLSCTPVLLVCIWKFPQVFSVDLGVPDSELSGFSVTTVVCYCIYGSPGHAELEFETRVLDIWNNKSWQKLATDLSMSLCITSHQLHPAEYLRRVTDKGERFLYSWFSRFRVQDWGHARDSSLASCTMGECVGLMSHLKMGHRERLDRSPIPFCGHIAVMSETPSKSLLLILGGSLKPYPKYLLLTPEDWSRCSNK